jgi:hypothetical protein
MPPLKLKIYGNGEVKEMEVPEKYAQRLRDEPLHDVVRDMNKDYQDYMEKQEDKKEYEN